MKWIFSALLIATMPVVAISEAKVMVGKKTTKGKKRTTASAGFYCSDAPEKVWGTYFGVLGSYVNPDEIFDVTFGTYEGSNAAMEEEPVEVVDFKSIKHDPTLVAKSSQWKNAKAFDVTTQEFGKAVLYIHPDAFAGGKDPIVRVKFESGKDVKIPCAPFK